MTAAVSTLSRPAADVYKSLCEEYFVKVSQPVLDLLQGRSTDTIVEIDLSKGYFGPKQALVLATLAQECPFLERIDLSGNSITPDVVERLCQVMVRGVVREIILKGNLLDITSGQRLADALRQNAAIAHCDVTGSSLPDYLLEAISVQAELNTLTFRAKEAANRQAADVAAPIPTCLKQLCFDEISNADDIGQLEHDRELSSCALDNADEPAAFDIEFSPPSGVQRPQSFLLQTGCAKYQTVDEIKKHVSDTMISGRPFVDTSFPVHDVTTVGPFAKHKWVRFSEFCSSHGVSPSLSGHSPLLRSSVPGFQWIRCALDVVRDLESLRKGLCVRSLPDLGIYVFAFYKGSEYVQVIVDDFVPVAVDDAHTRAHLLSCTRHEDISDAWAPLLEKAYAKLHQGYDRLLDGSMRYALSDFTGGMCCKKTWTISAIRMHRDFLFEEIRRHVVHKRIVAFKASAVGDMQRKSHEAVGLLANHAYLLVNADTSDNGNLLTIQLKSPNPAVTWCGRSGKTSSGRPGEFSMLFEDFVSFFDSMYTLCYVPQLDPTIRMLSVSGCATAAKSALIGSSGWPTNCSFFISTTAKEAQILVRVYQQDPRLQSTFRSAECDSGIDFHVFKGSVDSHTGSPLRLCSYNSTDEVLASAGQFVFGREALAQVVVHRNQPLQLVVSSTGDAVPIEVSLFSTSQFRLEKFDNKELSVAAASGSWEGATAAGRYHDSTSFEKGNQFIIQLQAPLADDSSVCHVSLWLEQTSSRYLMGVVGHFACERITDSSQCQNPMLSIDFQQRTAISTTFELSNARKACTILPMTWNSGEEGPFTITAYSIGGPVSIKSLPPVQKGRRV